MKPEFQAGIDKNSLKKRGSDSGATDLPQDICNRDFLEAIGIKSEREPLLMPSDSETKAICRRNI